MPDIAKGLFGPLNARSESLDPVLGNARLCDFNPRGGKLMLKKLALATVAVGLLMSTASADYYFRRRRQRSAKSLKRVRPKRPGSRLVRRPSKPKPTPRSRSRPLRTSVASPFHPMNLKQMRYRMSALGHSADITAITKPATRRSAVPNPKGNVAFHVRRGDGRDLEPSGTQ